MGSKFWINKKLLVTGGHGFLGTHLVKLVKNLRPKKLVVPSVDELDLREKENCRKAVESIDVVLHLAAKVGGIGYNKKHPGGIYYDNAVMGIHLLEEARRAGVKKFVAVGTVCAYPKFTPIPFSEESLWDGYPEETNAPYGLAKKMLLVQAQAYRDEYGFNAIYLLPANLYGSGDNFDPKSSHVIPALIKKFAEAKEKKKKTVKVWGSGNPTREFLYVKDAAEAILLAAEKYDEREPVNLGSGVEVSILALSELIKEAVGFRGKIVWDKSKPDGQPRRKIDISRAKKLFGFEAKTGFGFGLRETVEWYLKNK